MAIQVGDFLRVMLRGIVGGVQVQNVWAYRVVSEPGGVEAAHVGQAWWNHVKNAYRPVATTGYTTAFQLVRVEQLGVPDGYFGEYAIPAGEQAGTRATAGDATVASFVAVGVTLNVGTRVTRAGSKRLWGAGEGDLSGQYFGAAILGEAVLCMDACVGELTLGAPAALAMLQTVVARVNPSTGLVTASQDVIGHTVRSEVTSQVSRKLGRGV